MKALATARAVSRTPCSTTLSTCATILSTTGSCMVPPLTAPLFPQAPSLTLPRSRGREGWGRPSEGALSTCEFGEVGHLGQMVEPGNRFAQLARARGAE